MVPATLNMQNDHGAIILSPTDILQGTWKDFCEINQRKTKHANLKSTAAAGRCTREIFKTLVRVTAAIVGLLKQHEQVSMYIHIFSNRFRENGL